MVEYPVSVKINVDDSGLDRAEKKINKIKKGNKGLVAKLQTDLNKLFGRQSATPSQQEGGSGGSFLGLGKLFTGGVGKVLGKLGLITTLVGTIVSGLMNNPYLQAIAKMVGVLSTMFFLPISRLVFTLLKPALIGWAYLMKLWIKFWRNPKESFKNLFSGLGNLFKGADLKLKDFSGWIWDKLTGVWHWEWDFGGWLWNRLKNVWKWSHDFGGWLWNKLKSVWKWGKNFGSWLWGKLTSIWSWQFNLGKWLWSSIKTSISNSLKGVGDLGEWLKNKILSLFHIPTFPKRASESKPVTAETVINKIRNVTPKPRPVTSSGGGSGGSPFVRVSTVTSNGGGSRKTSSGGGSSNNSSSQSQGWFSKAVSKVVSTAKSVVHSVSSFVSHPLTTLTHATKKVFSWIGGLFHRSVGDAIITRNGVVHTSPSDTIIATNSPSPKNYNITVNVSGVVDESMIRNLAYRLRRELDLRGG